MHPLLCGTCINRTVKFHGGERVHICLHFCTHLHTFLEVLVHPFVFHLSLVIQNLFCVFYKDELTVAANQINIININIISYLDDT